MTASLILCTIFSLHTGNRLVLGFRVSNTQKPGRQNPARVRDHLANERTYLAWMRSAIALLGFGVVIVRLRQFQIPQVHRPGMGWKLGLLFSLVGKSDRVVLNCVLLPHPPRHR